MRTSVPAFQSIPTAAVLAVCSAFLAAAILSSPCSAQTGQGNAILTMGGGCSPLSGSDIQVRGCAPEGTRVYLVADPDPGPFVHELGSFGVAIGDDAIIRKGRMGPDGVAFFWLDDPIGDAPIGQNLYWQAAYYDPTAPNGLSITNRICLPVCPEGETFSCRGGIGAIEGILVVGPESQFPFDGTFEVASPTDKLAELPFTFELPGPGGGQSTADGMLEIQRIVPIQPCLESGEAHVAIQFRLDAGSLPEGILPDTTIFSAIVNGETTSVSLDTSCDTPIGVGLRYRPLILTCLESCPVLDFETQDDFSTPLVNGEAITSPSKFGNLVSISSSSAHGAAIFDSTIGGANDPGRDDDLLVDTGNLLIVQENGNQTTPGIFDDPDDNAGGGMIRFDFVRAVKPISIMLVDIDSSAEVELILTDDAGKTRTYTVPDHWTTDIEAQGGTGYGILRLDVLDPQPGFASTADCSEEAGFNEKTVLSLTVDLGGSGAIDNLRFCP